MVRLKKVLGMENSYQILVKKKNRRELVNFFVRFAFVIAMFLCLLLYLLSPTSKAGKLIIDGGIALNKERILNYLDIDENTSVFSLNSKDIETKLKSHSELTNIDVTLNPLTFKISFLEKAVSFVNDSSCYLYDGEVVEGSTNDYYQHQSLLAPEFLGEVPTDLTSYEKSLIISANLNALEKNSEYISLSQYDGEFYFYYSFADDNFIRVRFSFDDEFSLSYYLGQLRKNNVLNVYNEIDKSKMELSQSSFGNQQIKYYSLYFRLVNNNQEITSEWRLDKDGE